MQRYVKIFIFLAFVALGCGVPHSAAKIPQALEDINRQLTSMQTILNTPRTTMSDVEAQGMTTTPPLTALSDLVQVAQATPTFTPGALLFGASDGSITQDATNLSWNEAFKILNLKSAFPTPLQFKHQQANGIIDIQVDTSVNANVRSDMFGWGYNRHGEATNQPIWLEAFESQYVPAAPPKGLLERHFNYVSIDRTVAYRPWRFSVNLNNHEAITAWDVSRFLIIARQPNDIVYSFDTPAQGGALFLRPLSIRTDTPQLAFSTSDRQFRSDFFNSNYFGFGALTLQTYKTALPQGAFTDYAFLLLRAKALGLSVSGTTAPAAMYFQSGTSGSQGTDVGLRLNRNDDVLQVVDALRAIDPTGWQFSRVKLATPFLGVGTTRNISERIVVPNGGFLGSVDAAGTSTIKLIGLNASDTIRMDFEKVIQAGPAGNASPLPSKPEGYILIDIQGTEYAIPFYRK